MDNIIAPMAEELNRALGVDKETLNRELRLLIIDFKVPAEEARRSIMKKHKKPGVAGEVSTAHEEIIPGTGNKQGSDGAHKLLKDIRNGDTGITIIANIIGQDYRTIPTANGESEVINGMLEDATARVHFTSWVDIPELATMKSAIFKNVYVKSFHGMPSININERSSVEEYTGDAPGYVTRRCSLAELMEGDGAYDIEVEADVISIRPGSGLIERCPVCNRVMQKGQCRAHGKLDGTWDMRIKVVIDDGTGSMICVFDRVLTGRLIGTSIDEIIGWKDTPDRIDEHIKAAMVGTPLVIKGNVTRGDYGRILVATAFARPSEDIGELARTLMGELL